MTTDVVVPVRVLQRSRHVANSWFRTALLDRATTQSLLLLSAVPLLVAVGLLVVSRTLLSREMTWDLLFNLSGAWHVVNGHAPHVDFREPLGSLNFQLTSLGFRMIGASPLAFLVAEFFVLALVYAASLGAVVTRLPLAAGIVFVVQNALLVILPLNPGDLPSAYSFAMSYNRWCWAALTTLCLILFIEPDRRRGWVDATIGGALVAFMFHVKITFGMAGVAAVIGAMIWMPHLHAHWKAWTFALGAVVIDLAAPYNRPYLNDVWEAAAAGYVRGSPLSQIFSVVSNDLEYALYGGMVLALVLLWRYKLAPLHSVVSAFALLVLGAFVLSQNSQARYIPIGMVITFLVYDAVRRHQPSLLQRMRTRDLALVLAIVLSGPLLSAASEAATFVGYARASVRTDTLWRVRESNLRGLAVPLDDPQPISMRPGTRLNYAGEIDRRLSSADYVQTLIEAAEWFSRSRSAPVRVLTLDSVNAMPFVLGYPPPRGGDLWLEANGPARTPEEMFADVDVVLVPKHAIHPASTAAAIERYREALDELFPLTHETTSWIILARPESPQRGG